MLQSYKKWAYPVGSALSDSGGTSLGETTTVNPNYVTVSQDPALCDADNNCLPPTNNNNPIQGPTIIPALQLGSLLDDPSRPNISQNNLNSTTTTTNPSAGVTANTATNQNTTANNLLSSGFGSGGSGSSSANSNLTKKDIKYYAKKYWWIIALVGVGSYAIYKNKK